MLFINLTPLIPLSILGEGEEFFKEGLTPLLHTPAKTGNWRQNLMGGRVGRNWFDFFPRLCFN
jgi:hypothetical protein